MVVSPVAFVGMAANPPDDEAMLSALDRENRHRLSEQLQRGTAEKGEDLIAGGLAGVLFDVLVEGGKEGTPARQQLDEVWERLDGDASVINRRSFDYEAFMVGAFATIVAIDLALDEESAAKVRHAFQREPSSLIHRFRRQVPGRQRFVWYMDYYGEALGPERHPDRTWYVPVARAFAHACRELAADRDAFAAAEYQVAAAGLEVFLRAASGTIEAVRGWNIL